MALKIHKMALRREHRTVTGDFLQIFTSILFPSLKNIQEDLLKKKKVVCYVGISSVSINHAEKIYISLVHFTHLREILSALKDKIRIPAQPCNILYL